MKFEYLGNNDGRLDLIDASQLAFDSSQLRKDCYKIIWARNDSLNLGVDGYRIYLKKNHLLFVSPLNSLDFQVDHQDIVVYTFNREFYCIRDHDEEVSCNGFLFLGSSAPLMVELTEDEQKKFNFIYAFFVEEFENKDHIQGEMLLVLLKRLLIISVRIARKLLPQKDMPQTKLDTIRKFNLLVEMHFREKHKVADYAELMHLTPKSLSNLFTRYYKKSPLKVIMERIVLEAKRLLEFSDHNINEISNQLGFEEAAHFSHFFKKHTGMSPRTYKEKVTF
jgi:AraC-like DNA-binding protein